MFTAFLIVAALGVALLMLGVTTPTSYYARLTGTETWTDAVNFGTPTHIFGGAVSFTGNPTFSGTPAFSGTPTFSNAVTLPAGTLIGDVAVDRTNRVVAIPAGSTQLTLAPATHGFRLVTLAPTGGLTITLPAATGSQCVYTLCLTAAVTGGNLLIDGKTPSANLFGIAFQNKDGAGITTTPSTATTNLITLNGSTTGGLAGDIITLQDVATNVFSFDIQGKYSGTFGTPLSNH